ncbi:MAG: 2-amino-4-hydroxy-6-hydroxymethyldihydropteridine diphosphokinase, partial [Proteobacteria bacterium]|nr:2-amino-4-hydroxy-6-hydroxymethyldihydropteridine diphosphokinase [Pseudomonadota bacterium]
RWTSRVLDLDVIFWSAGTWVSPGLTVPHLEFRQRAFVLQPAAAIAPRWRDPLTGLTPRHLAARLAKPKRRP